MGVVGRTEAGQAPVETGVAIAPDVAARLPLAGTRWGREAALRRVLASADALTGAGAGVVLAALDRDQRAVWLVPLAVAAAVLLAKIHGLYELDQRSLRHTTADELPRLVAWSGSLVAALALGAGALGTDGPGPLAAVGCGVGALSLGAALRAGGRALWRGATVRERAIVVGSGPLSAAVARRLELLPGGHVGLAGTVSTVEDLLALPERLWSVEHVLLADDRLDQATLTTLAARCREAETKLHLASGAAAVLGPVRAGRVGELPLLSVATDDPPRSTLALKRTLDVVAAGLGLVVLAPVLLVIGLLIRLDSPGPALFVQRRAGRGGVPFRMLKFRTMVDGAAQQLEALVPFDGLAEPRFKLREDPRVTRVGRVLRRFSVDELPQLVNVLRGQMSLVGPRPEQVELVERYTPRQRVRLAMTPGMTGPMQVSGRADLSLDEIVSVEQEYMENVSLVRDVQILASTITSVVRGRGAY